MSKLDFRLNREGVRTLMRSPEMKAVLKDRADTVKDRHGDGTTPMWHRLAPWL